MERLEAVVAMQGIGEGASSGVEIDVLYDEMKFLHGLAFAMLAERELERAPVPHELTG
jgi:hypothetical protein